MTHIDLPPETGPRRAPIALWRFAGQMIRDIHDLFGAPEHIASTGALSRALYKQMLHWIGAAEALLRRLLLVEARIILAKGGASIAKTHRPRRRRKKRLVVWRPDEPEKWRVTFRAFDTRPQAVKRRAGAPAENTSACDAWPLALRCEALLRVFNDPIPYARRLARRLAATPRQLREIAPALVRAIGGCEIWAELETLCRGDQRSVPTDSS